MAALPTPIDRQTLPGRDAIWRDPLELLLASTGEGVYGVDLDGRCVFINRAGAAMIGYAPSELLGCNMHDLTHHARADGSPYPEADCPIFNAFRQGLPCRIDSEVFWRRDGSAFPVEYSSHPILDQGQVRGAVVTFVDITERRRAADALQKAKDELEERVRERTAALETALRQVRELAAWSESVREEERTRIAREVHDELGSLLVALKMDVNWMDKRLSEQGARSPDEAEDMRGRMRCKCQNMSRLIETAVDNVGRIITDLRPSILDHQGLWAALEWQAQEFVASAELALDWCMAVDESLELPEPQAMAVFRIFQEMLSNVGRHAQASQLRVEIARVGGELVVAVEDDGVGAPAQAFEAGDAYGIMGMRERARHFGGRIDIRSVPGEGTCMRLRLQLPGGDAP
ncbi:MAG TPA: PAS domain-containing sensor histidine kinase [Hydrogenophaga sp.]|uniref:sensor histidine kinase n=1 Tax=Hydrogenophaga sp. TaxID=1904254 RepID=UPI002C8208E2|nr:PAS domain-containing sensor histidine kinase [Hydrogenophaga sp.]HMN93045.1 PAS domain-containing sensor histidine kinase [Hydrogenophaga sp.]HMP09824.1 PAS domain-containing sensor histidine kinase [Hydrogenophaga sp.]